eukprot:CAMPEP_0197894722 /NCGR_PEP_ID=MMETSP1439-20131203/35985_2 /TAXON_ID=66791 /ORGANISM="Gonyaulax spinifera, Strain CCMP409" /LENGTH=184 /DNA_ID=CAMNT_0043515105 /DNA_START=21 /DNA_END=576 /DNA_ORIENTATION=-
MSAPAPTARPVRTPGRPPAPRRLSRCKEQLSSPRIASTVRALSDCRSSRGLAQREPRRARPRADLSRGAAGAGGPSRLEVAVGGPHHGVDKEDQDEEADAAGRVEAAVPLRDEHDGQKESRDAEEQSRGRVRSLLTLGAASHLSVAAVATAAAADLSSLMPPRRPAAGASLAGATASTSVDFAS